jgi:hypothetical protein
MEKYRPEQPAPVQDDKRSLRKAESEEYAANRNTLAALELPDPLLEKLRNWKPPMVGADRLNGEYEKKLEYNLDLLKEYEDDKELVVELTIQNQPFRATAGQLRKELEVMGDPEKGRQGGWSYGLYVLSEDPDGFFKEREERLEKNKNRHLTDLAPYADEQFIWVVYPNEGNKPHPTTAGELRTMLEEYDDSMDEMLSHAGGFDVVSTDPHLDAEAFEEEGNRLFHEAVLGSIGRVEAKFALINVMQQRLDAFKPSTEMLVKFKSDDEPKEMTVAQLSALIGAMTVESLQSSGVPEVRVKGAAAPELPAVDEKKD